MTEEQKGVERGGWNVCVNVGSVRFVFVQQKRSCSLEESGCGYWWQRFPYTPAYYLLACM
jgi:hypothetical protein